LNNGNSAEDLLLFNNAILSRIRSHLSGDSISTINVYANEHLNIIQHWKLNRSPF